MLSGKIDFRSALHITILLNFIGVELMILQPIIQSKLNTYKKRHSLTELSDGLAFERFVNETVLTNHQPDAFTTDNDLLENVCIGGQNDMGLDGICIKVNGNLISTVSEAKDLITTRRTADIEFIFLQSKYKDKFDSGEYGKFTTGVLDFLSDTQVQPRNDKVTEWLQVKEYLLSEEVLAFWPQNPIVRLYYVAMGNWDEKNYPHIVALSKRLEMDIDALNTFEEVSFNYLDSSSYKKMCDENDNAFTAILNIIDSSSLPEVNNVDNSSIILCTADSLLKMLLTNENLIRKTLFTDNVRDYQGDTTINNEILSTLENSPQSFALLNNGITIVCDEIILANRKITIKNPQIVNGCQTCNVIFQAYKKEVDLSNVVVSAKVISTSNYDVINQIVKGTNRQNIVFDEAFEITKPFHKVLEDFFNSMPLSENITKIYYERRSKQYTYNSTILPSQKVNFKTLTQSFVSIFLREPHNGHRHESKLLDDYQNMIFIDNQSKYPYYTSSLVFIKIENYYRKGLIPKELRPYKAHLAFLVKELAMPNAPSINAEKEIGQYCEQLLPLIWDDAKFNDFVRKAVQIFNDTKSRWIHERGTQYRFGIKDSVEFTNLLKKCIISDDTPDNKDSSYRGTVIKTGHDRYNKLYGFISKQPRDVFFHENDNPNVNIAALIYKEVLYDTKYDSMSSTERAINITLV